MTNEIIIATLGVFVGEFYGNFVGGGSLVTQAVLQNVLHFDIKTAMALDNAAVVGSNLGMMIALWRHQVIKWWFGIFTIFQVLGAIIGAWVLIVIDPGLLKILFVAGVVLLVIKNLFMPEKAHDETGFVPDKKNVILLSLAAIFIGAYNAAFVIGDWVIALLILTRVFSIRYHHAIYLLVVSMLFSQPVAAYEYYQAGLIDLDFLIPMISATFVGGILSGTLLNKIHSHRLEQFLKYLSVGLVVYLIWGLLG